MEWSYAVTAVPQRADNLLVQTVRELEKGGFPEPTIFLDGELPKPSVLSNYSIIEHPRIGHIRNWLMALHYVYHQNPHADYFAIFEDDLLCVPNLRQYLERCEYPEKGYWNLLTHNPNYIKIGPQKGWHLSNQRGWGAVGLVFNQGTLYDLLTSSKFYWFCRGGRESADGLVNYVLKRSGYKEYVHSPSLLQHVGTQSTLKHVYGQMIGFQENYDPMEGTACT